MKREDIYGFLDKTIESVNLSSSKIKETVRGKVRDIFDIGEYLLIVTTDRISAFDRVLTTIPCKGEVLNRISLFWFERTSDIISNHIEKKITSRAVLVKKCEVLPIEVVVRGYLTGSAWRDYQAGKPISGIRLRDGLRFNEKFDTPIVTPSTKAERGVHDEPISEEELVKRGIVEIELWQEVRETALKLFERGTEIAGSHGLILVDTKYEFGLCDGKLVLVDEMHTPDSSRYWFKESYRELFERGEKQKKFDKEYLRQWLIERGFMGDGDIPDIPDEVKVEVAWKYIQAYEQITGAEFMPESYSSGDEEKALLDFLNSL